MEDEVSDADAARAIERQMRSIQERVGRGGVMEYLKPLGSGGRKYVNKLFLASTIKSVDSHNRRHEEEKCWKFCELENKLDNRKRSRGSRSRSRSPHRNFRRERSRSRGRSVRSRDYSRSDSNPSQGGRKNRSRSPKCHVDSSRRHNRRSRSRERSSTLSVQLEKSTQNADPGDEREFWAAKKAEKTKKMWETMYSSTAPIMVDNAPEFSSSDDDSDDEDERVMGSPSDHRKEKKHKKEKKSKSKKKKMKKKKKEDNKEKEKHT